MERIDACLKEKKTAHLGGKELSDGLNGKPTEQTDRLLNQKVAY